MTDNGNGSGAIAFTTGFEDAGNYTIELIATDNGTPNLRDTLSFALTVNNVNRAPVLQQQPRNRWTKTAAFRCRYRRVIPMATASHFPRSACPRSPAFRTMGTAARRCKFHPDLKMPEITPSA
ncbi:MAG: hypothetical protein R3C26_20535 [Calditrichia bacterium]